MNAIEALIERTRRYLAGEPLEPPVTEESLAALRERNAERARQAIQQLGPRWVGFNRGRKP